MLNQKKKKKLDVLEDLWCNSEIFILKSLVKHPTGWNLPPSEIFKMWPMQREPVASAQLPVPALPTREKSFLVQAGTRLVGSKGKGQNSYQKQVLQVPQCK